MQKIIRQDSFVIPLLIVLSLTIAGCSSTSSSTTVENEVATENEVETSAVTANETISESAPDAEPLQLGADIDVQTVASIMDRDDVFLLDVREQSEYDAGHIRGNTLIPTGSIADRLAEIPKDKEVIIYCHSGVRSSRTFDFLTEQGYTNIHNMVGGIVAWQDAGFEVE